MNSLSYKQGKSAQGKSAQGKTAQGKAAQERASKSSDKNVPPPFTEQIIAKAFKELPDGARLAVETCLDLWREKVLC